MPAPERTTLTQIVDAGRDILERSGPDGLTMQAVAERVGVRAPSLYKRVRDRSTLLAAVAEDTIDALTARLEEAGDDLAALGDAYRAFAHERPEGFRLMFAAAAPQAALERSSAPVLRACSALVGQDDALDAARLFTAWATGFLQMEIAGAFRLGGDVERAFSYGLRRLVAGLSAAP